MTFLYENEAPGLKQAAVVTMATRISFLAKEDRFLMLFQTFTKLTFGLSYILLITVITRDRINSVGSLFLKCGRLVFCSIQLYWYLSGYTSLFSTSSYKLGFYRYGWESRTFRNITADSIYILIRGWLSMTQLLLEHSWRSHYSSFVTGSLGLVSK